MLCTIGFLEVENPYLHPSFIPLTQLEVSKLTKLGIPILATALKMVDFLVRALVIAIEQNRCYFWIPWGRKPWGRSRFHVPNPITFRVMSDLKSENLYTLNKIIQNFRILDRL